MSNVSSCYSWCTEDAKGKSCKAKDTESGSQRLENAFNTFVKNCVAIKIKLNAFKKALSD